MLQREFNKVYSGKNQQAAVIPATVDVIEEIKEINKTRPEGAKLDVPNPGDLIGYSQRQFTVTPTKITDEQRKKYTASQIYEQLVIPDVENTYNTYQGDARAQLYVENIKANKPDARVVTAKTYIEDLTKENQEIKTLVNEGKYEEAALALGIESPIGVVYYKITSGKDPVKTLDTYIPLVGNKDTVIKGMLMETAKLYGLSQREASNQYLRYKQRSAQQATEEVDEFAQFAEN